MTRTLALLLSIPLTTAYQNAFIPRTFLPSVPSSSSYTPSSLLTMKVSKGKSKASRSKGCTIAIRNDERMKIAGRRGTKKFTDPNKLFVGNLPYHAKDTDLESFLFDNGVISAHVVSVKIIRDWKTSKSKGYGFVQFLSPIFATSALEMIRNKTLLGRVVRLDQGKKKAPEVVVVVKKTDVKDLKTEEDLVLGTAIAEAEEEFYIDDIDGYNDDELFSEVDDDDDDFEYDGVYEEEFLPQEEGVDTTEMNREQRREAAKSIKKRRKPGNGFGV